MNIFSVKRDIDIISKTVSKPKNKTSLNDDQLMGGTETKSVNEIVAENDVEIDVSNTKEVAKLFKNQKANSRKWKRIGIAVGIVVGILEFIIMILIGTIEISEFTIGLPIFAGAGVYFLGSRKLRGAATNVFRNAVLFPVILKTFPDCYFSESAEINSKWMKDYGIVPKIATVLNSNYFKAEAVNDNPWFELCHVDAYSNNSNNNTVTYLDGTILHTKLTRGINGTVRILTTRTNAIGVESIGTWCKKLSNESKIETESIEFNKNFEVYAANEVEGYLIVNPYVIERLQALRKRIGEYCMFVEDDNVYLFSRSGKFLVGTPINFDDSAYNKGIYTAAVVADVEQTLKHINEVSAYISGHIV